MAPWTLCGISLTMSLRETRNRVGLRTPPWGTPSFSVFFRLYALSVVQVLWDPLIHSASPTTLLELPPEAILQDFVIRHLHVYLHRQCMLFVLEAILDLLGYVCRSLDLQWNEVGGILPTLEWWCCSAPGSKLAVSWSHALGACPRSWWGWWGDRHLHDTSLSLCCGGILVHSALQSFFSFFKFAGINCKMPRFFRCKTIPNHQPSTTVLDSCYVLVLICCVLSFQTKHFHFGLPCPMYIIPEVLWFVHLLCSF